jgi:hypothetical protein
MKRRGHAYPWTARHQRTALLLWPTHSTRKIAGILHVPFHIVKDRLYRIGLRRGRHTFSKADEQMMREKYADTPTQELANLFGTSLGAVHRFAARLNLSKSKEYVARIARERTLRPNHGGRLHRFQPGHPSWNKGRKMPKSWSTPGMKRTQFKKGQKPTKWRPVGSTRIDVDGYMWRKVADIRHSEPNWWTGWKMEHVLLWEKRHKRKVPKGHVIIFRDKNRLNFQAKNLRCISRKELARMNHHGYLNYPLELRRLIIAAGKLRNLIQKKEKHAGKKQVVRSAGSSVRKHREVAR